MPKGYVVARANVTNQPAWGEYAAKASEAIKKYGGTPLVRGGRCETLEGEGRARNVVIEFASYDAAMTYAARPSMRPRRPCARARGRSTSWWSKARPEAATWPPSRALTDGFAKKTALADDRIEPLGTRAGRSRFGSVQVPAESVPCPSSLPWR